MRPERAYSPAARGSEAPDPDRVLVIGCGALARELVAVIDQAGLTNVDLTCLPATLHNRPGGIPALVREKIRAARPRYSSIFVAYADCGTGGLLDTVLDAEGIARLEGAHCYEVYAGRAAFASLHDAEPGTFYLTDYLVRNFDRLVVRGLGLDRHPELRELYFGNYRRLVYLAQADDASLTARAEAAADRLGLAFERRLVGLGELTPALAAFASPAASDPRGPKASYLSEERRSAERGLGGYPGKVSISGRNGSGSRRANFPQVGTQTTEVFSERKDSLPGRRAPGSRRRRAVVVA